MSFAGVQLRTLRPQAVQRRYFWKTASAQREQLAGTVHSHNSLILLNTRIPPPSFPSKVSSKLQRSLQLHASRWGGIVNLAWVPGTPVNNPNSTEPEWENPSEESYSAIAFSTENGTLEIPEVSTHNLEDVVVQLREHAAASSTAGPNSIGKANANSDSDAVHIYVCTHGQRDCRCGETGGAVYDALRDEVARRSLQDVVKVGGVGHVGGHKYAANVLVYPYGDWLGYVTPADVPAVLDNIMSLRKSPFSATTTPPLCPPFWRGRMGLDKEQQLQLFRATPVSNEVLSADLKPHSRS